ncbi:hypothetical protein ABIA23_002354 [Sinorhizobium fredii]
MLNFARDRPLISNLALSAARICVRGAAYPLWRRSLERRSEMSQEWPMFILQCIVVFGLVSALFIRFGE